MKKWIWILAIVPAIIQLGNAQQIDWVRQYGGNGSDTGGKMLFDKDGNLYQTLLFTDTIDADPGPGVALLPGPEGQYSHAILKLNPEGVFIWAKQLESSSILGLNFTFDSLGNLVVFGSFRDSIDLDPGPGVVRLVSAGNYDFFIAWYSSEGDYLQHLHWGSPTIERISSVAFDSQSNLIMTGTFTGPIDIDPGPNVQMISPIGTYAAFYVKLDMLANIIWVKQRNNITSSDGGGEIELTPAGSILIGGRFGATIDFDPGPGTSQLSKQGDYSAFVLHLDADGNFIWAKSIRSNTEAEVRQMIILDNGDIRVYGVFNGTIDLDPGVGTFIVESGLNVLGQAFYMLTLTSAGEFKSARTLGNSQGTLFFYKPIHDSRGNMYLTGGYRGTIDFDPGPGSLLHSTTDSSEILLLKLDPNLNFIWLLNFPSVDLRYNIGSHLAVSPTDVLYVNGTFRGRLDFDPGPDSLIMNSSSQDIFLLRIAEGPCDNFTLLIDSVKAVTCTESGSIHSHATNGIAPYSYVWNTDPPQLDSAIILTAGGVFGLTATDQAGCSKQTQVLIAQPPVNIDIDMAVNLTRTSFRPGLEATVFLDAGNFGCGQATGDLQLTIDPRIEYLSAEPSPDMVTGNTVTWHYSDLTFSDTHITPQVNVMVPATLVIGDTVNMRLSIASFQTDENPADNDRTYKITIVNSLDPNEKQAYPPGACPEQYIRKDEPITYTIHFQNIGSAPAFEVAVIDTLDLSLDINSMMIEGSSHDMITEIIAPGVLKFQFHNIQLAGAANNEPASHGYIHYRILPKTAIATNTPIRNAAGIYFDFNDPVHTNKISHTVVDELPECITSTNQAGGFLDHINIFPNPTHSHITVEFPDGITSLSTITLYDLMGRVVFKENFPSDQGSLDLAIPAEGIFLLKIECGKFHSFFKLLRI